MLCLTDIIFLFELVSVLNRLYFYISTFRSMCMYVCMYVYYYYYYCHCRRRRRRRRSGCIVLRHVLCFCRHEKGCSGVKLGCQYHLTVSFLLIWAVQLLGGANFSRCSVTVAPFHLERSVPYTHTHTHAHTQFLFYITTTADFRRLKCNCYLYMTFPP